MITELFKAALSFQILRSYTQISYRLRISSVNTPFLGFFSYFEAYLGLRGIYGLVSSRVETKIAESWGLLDGGLIAPGGFGDKKAFLLDGIQAIPVHRDGSKCI